MSPPLPGSIFAQQNLQRPFAGTGALRWYVKPPVALNWRVIRFGNGTWIALALNGAGNQILKSRDGGLSWASKAEPSTRQWLGLATNGLGHWVAVGQGGAGVQQVMYSNDDGENWISGNMPAMLAWQDVCWAGGNNYIAINNNGLIAQQVAVSNDGGATWHFASGGAASLRLWHAIAFGNGVAIAVATDGAGNQTMRSVDGGDNWASVAEATTKLWWDVRYNGKNRWVAVANDSVANNIMYSDDDGVSWTQGDVLATVPQSDWSSLAFGNNSWLAIDANMGAQGVSLDGKTFARMPFIDSIQFYDVDYGYDRFIAVGYSYFRIS